jgi:hypothetical protein
MLVSPVNDDEEPLGVPHLKHVVWSIRDTSHLGAIAMLNRSLLVIKYKQPFIDWVNEADPYPKGRVIRLEDANEDSPAYLIHEDAAEYFEEWLRDCYSPLFENILGEWYTDPTLCPQDRTLKLFKTWCDFELHSMVLDYVDGPLLDDDFD